MTDEALREVLGVMSFLLAGLSFLTVERREAIKTLHESSTVTSRERTLAIGSVGLLCLAAFALLAVTAPAVLATDLGFDDLLRVHSTIREAFVLGWLFLLAIALSLAALVGRAWEIEVASTT